MSACSTPLVHVPGQSAPSLWPARCSLLHALGCAGPPLANLWTTTPTSTGSVCHLRVARGTLSVCPAGFGAAATALSDSDDEASLRAESPAAASSPSSPAPCPPSYRPGRSPASRLAACAARRRVSSGTLVSDSDDEMVVLAALPVLARDVPLPLVNVPVQVPCVCALQRLFRSRILTPMTRYSCLCLFVRCAPLPLSLPGAPVLPPRELQLVLLSALARFPLCPFLLAPRLPCPLRTPLEVSLQRRDLIRNKQPPSRCICFRPFGAAWPMPSGVLRGFRLCSL